jgi:hypothetical protein
MLRDISNLDCNLDVSSNVFGNFTFWFTFSALSTENSDITVNLHHNLTFGRELGFKFSLK